jgi:hypothetical protein
MIGMLYAGAYLGPKKLNKAGSIVMNESIRGIKVSCEYIKTQWKEDE